MWGRGGEGRRGLCESEDGRRRTSDGTKDGQRSGGSVLLLSLQTHSRERRNLGTLREKLNKTGKAKKRRAVRTVGPLGRLGISSCLFENGKLALTYCHSCRCQLLLEEQLVRLLKSHDGNCQRKKKKTTTHLKTAMQILTANDGLVEMLLVLRGKKKRVFLKEETICCQKRSKEI